MDPATAPGPGAEAVRHDHHPAPGDPPPGDPAAEPVSLGVPAIPVQAGRDRPPAAVPSTGADQSGTPSLPPPVPVPAVLVAAGPPPTGPSGRVAAGEGGFDPGVAAALGRYVYLLVDPRTGRAFYAGRGRGDRCFDHLRAAQRVEGAGEPAAEPQGRERRFPLLDRIREIEGAGRQVRIDILRHGLSADEATLVAEVATDMLGVPTERDPGSGRRTVPEIRSLLAKPAKIKRAHPVVLLRVGAAGTDTSYETARHHWRVGRRWTDLHSPRSPRWALLVAGDLVASVHRIEAWEPTPSPGAGGWAGSPALERYSFAGPADPELGARYVGRSVAAYLRPRAPSPVTYVWCGPHWVNAGR